MFCWYRIMIWLSSNGTYRTLKKDIKNPDNSNLTFEGVSGVCARYTVLSGYDPTHLTIFGDFHSQCVIANCQVRYKLWHPDTRPTFTWRTERHFNTSAKLTSVWEISSHPSIHCQYLRSSVSHIRDTWPADQETREDQRLCLSRLNVFNWKW